MSCSLSAFRALTSPRRFWMSVHAFSSSNSPSSQGFLLSSVGITYLLDTGLNATLLGGKVKVNHGMDLTSETGSDSPLLSISRSTRSSSAITLFFASCESSLYLNPVWTLPSLSVQVPLWMTLSYHFSSACHWSRPAQSP